MHHGDRLIPTLFHQRLAVAARYGRTAIADEDDEVMRDLSKKLRSIKRNRPLSDHLGWALALVHLD
jgi:hypothetical protein